MTEICFEVDGKPRPKERPRRGKSGVFYTPKATSEWEDHVAAAARACTRGRAPLMDPCAVELIFRCADPRSDIDNLAKSVLDAMNGIVYDDDSQVVRLHIDRSDEPEPGVTVRVRPFDVAVS